MSTAGQAVGGLVGAVAGWFVGGPSGALYGAQIGIGVGAYLDPAKGPVTEGPRLSDLSVQTSTYGAVIPRVYGTVTVNGNVFWLENNQIRETVTKKKSGGKGGGSNTTSLIYTYDATFAVALDDTRAKGAPVVGVRRIWIGPNLYYDAGSSDPDTIAASNAAASTFTFYPGSETQSPDPRMQAALGVDNTPAYRGLAYIVFYDLPLADYGNSLLGAQVKVELFDSGTYDRYPVTAIPGAGSGSTVHTAWTGSAFVRFFFFNQNAYVSEDNGETWTPYATPIGASPAWQGVAVGGGRVVAVASVAGDDVIVSSDGGHTWTLHPLPAGMNAGQVAFGNNLFVVTDSRYYATSADGQSWVRGDLPFNSAGNGSKILYNGAKFFVWMNSHSKAMTSVTGSAPWTLYDLALSNHNFSAQKNGQVMLGSNGGLPALVSSTCDAGSWASVAVLPFSQWLTADLDHWVCFGNFDFGYSADGVTWTTIHGTLPVSAQWTGGVFNGSVISIANTVSTTGANIIPYLVSPGPTTLDAIVSSECLQSGLLAAGDIDVTALTSDVRGYRIGSVGPIRSALEPLRAAWPFDVVQRGYKIVFVDRGGSSVGTIPAADLDARPGGAEPGVQITTAREMDSQLPVRVSINHLDIEREYDTGTQYAERLNTSAINLVNHDLPIVLTATEAAGKAEVLLYLAWLERYDVALNLPPTWLQLEPADVVGLTTPEGVVSLRLASVTYTADGRVECTAKYANPAIYTPTAVGESGQSTGGATIARVGASLYVLLDIPLVHDAQANSGFPVAMYGQLTGWRGGVLYQSTDSGATWAAIDDFAPPGATIGIASNTIGAVESRMIDKASRLTVVLANGDLFDITELAMLNGANHFAYGAAGRWEIIAAQKCTLQSGSTYILSDLLRGRYGTEQYMSTHATGDQVILLDVDDLAIIAMSTSTIGLARDYRGITIGQDISTDSNRSFTYSAINLKPIAPFALTGNRDPSTNDWTLTWLRRTRIGGAWRDNVDADIGETSEQYQIDIFADGSYASLKRTISVTAAAAAYSSADQVTDFGSNQATLYLKLYQLSATVGRGYPLTTSITR